MTNQPPILTLNDCNNAQLQRLLQIKTTFTEKFGEIPSFISRAPGRVNLIGEHIDYCGYSVLPMALEQEILIAFNTNDTEEICIVNKKKDYSPFKCNVNSVQIDKSIPKWYNYILCGYVGITEHFKLSKPVGMLMCVDGNIPPSAGLSSSSALVCAAALAALHANGLEMSKKEIAALCARSERYVGTEGGGMDPAISFMAQTGTAKLIEFNPLRTTDVQLPSGALFVIANSCSDINKAATSDYNTRVVECRLAAQIIAKRNGLDWKNYRVLGDLQQAISTDLIQMCNVVASSLHLDPYSRKEVCDILEISDDELKEISLNSNTLDIKSFELYKRAMHVFTEANRVLEFKRVCDEHPTQSLEKLGDLMNESHKSCRDLFECSHPNLDEFVEIALNAGALGSRLTGAGWGGCTVSLIPSGKLPNFLETVTDKFYAHEQERMLNYASNLFHTEPGRGAAIFKL